MVRNMLVALRRWAVRHVLRSKHERYGDLVVFDEMLVYLPIERIDRSNR
jgi:hypothetical protein